MSGHMRDRQSVNNTINETMPDPVTHFQALYMINTQETKIHLIKSRFEQMCPKTFLKAPINLQSVIHPETVHTVSGQQYYKHDPQSL